MEKNTQGGNNLFEAQELSSFFSFSFITGTLSAFTSSFYLETSLLLSILLGIGIAGTFLLYGIKLSKQIDTKWLKRIEDIEKERQLALQASKAKSEFLSSMSHEIRTPLNGILGMTELLLQSELSSEQRLHLHVLQSSGNALLATITNILDYSKIEAGKMELSFEWFSINELIVRVAAPVEAQKKAKRITLDISTSTSIPSSLHGCFDAIGQVIINLLGNAVKFTPGGGKVTLQFSFLQNTDKAGTLEVAVIDNGPGIPRIQMKKVFEAFTQIPQESGKTIKGTGLGLKICAHLIELMKGKIWIDKEYIRGSAFHFFVPVEFSMEERREKTDLQSEEEIESSILPDNLHLLLVEDNHFNQMVMLSMLNNERFKVTTVTNGNDALSELEQNSFDLVLMDCELPGMDGFEATRAIRKKEEEFSHHLPIVAVTARASTDEVERCRVAGMDAFLPKPFTQKDLLHVIKEAMRLYR